MFCKQKFSEMQFINESFGPTNASFGNRSTWDASGGFNNPFKLTHFRVLFIICYSLVFTLCILGNAMVLFAIARSPRLRSMTNFLLANLAFADFLVGAVCVLPNLSTFLQPNWILGRAMCKIYYYMWNVSYTASILILMVIAIERYIAILHPLKARHFMTDNRLVLVQIGVWVIALIYNIPFLVFYDTIRFSWNETEFCYAAFDYMESLKWLSLVNVLIWYLLPFLVIGFMYYRVARALWKTTRLSSEKPHQHKTEEIPMQCHSTHRIRSEQESSRDRLSYVNSPGQHNLEVTDVKNQKDKTLNTEYHLACKGSKWYDVVCTSRQREDDSPQEKKCLFPVHTTSTSFAVNESEITRAHNGFGENSNLHGLSKSSLRKINRNRHTQMSNSGRIVKARKKVIRLLVCIVACFGICVLPHMLKVLNHYWMIFDLPHSVNTVFSPISFIILYLNSVLNPVLYALFSNNFRRSFKEALPFFRPRRTNTKG